MTLRCPSSSPAAAASVRTAAAVRPCRPITRPELARRHEQLDTVCPRCSLLGHPHAVRLIGQRLRDDLDDVARAAHDAGCSTAAARRAGRRRRHPVDQRPHGVGRLRAGLQPVREPIALQVQRLRLRARVVVPEHLDEPAVARRAQSVTTTRKNGRFFEPVRLRRIANISAPDQLPVSSFQFPASGLNWHWHWHRYFIIPFIIPRPRIFFFRRRARPCRRAASASSASARTASAAG